MGCDAFSPPLFIQRSIFSDECRNAAILPIPAEKLDRFDSE